MSEKKDSNNSGLAIIVLIAVGFFFGVGPFRNAKCSSDKPKIETQQQWDGSFSGRKYDCERCLCKKYEKKSTFNSDCKNCGHIKSWHYSQK
ncbi:MAG: hypothetical protein LBM67_07580 [Lentimicrobiaceae bacterium]|jgi:hypothetical protein|nr:hypothetical protein [Lentimicrobiaceae bacterium]